MSSIALALKTEIQRVARKAIRTEIEATRKFTLQHRRDIAGLKRQVKAMEQMNRAIRGQIETTVSAAAEAEGRPVRFSAKGLTSLRVRLGLSAAEIARILDVSPQTIYNWEQKKSTPRREQMEALLTARKLTKRSARQKLEELSAAA